MPLFLGYAVGFSLSIGLSFDSCLFRKPGFLGSPGCFFVSFAFGLSLSCFSCLTFLFVLDCSDSRRFSGGTLSFYPLAFSLFLFSLLTSEFSRLFLRFELKGCRRSCFIILDLLQALALCLGFLLLADSLLFLLLTSSSLFLLLSDACGDCGLLGSGSPSCLIVLSGGSHL